MNLKTDFFGDLEIDENKIIRFNSGLPAFADETSFIIIKEDENKDSIFCWLQSINTPSLIFALIDTFSVMPEYNPLVDEESISDLGEYNEQDFMVYNIASVPDDVANITINLKAPIIINMKDGLGKQVIVNNQDYSIQHKIFDQLKGRK